MASERTAYRSSTVSRLRSSSRMGPRRFVRKTMRVLTVLVGLLMSIPVLAASPRIEAAIRVIQTVGTDENRLKTFCELMKIDEQNEHTPNPTLEASMDKLLDELGTDFKEAWDTAESMDPASEDGKALHGALDRLSERCPRG
jgi:hypothetical protein